MLAVVHSQTEAPRAAVFMGLRFARQGRGLSHLAVPSAIGQTVSFDVLRTVCGETLSADDLTSEIVSPASARRYWRSRVCELCDGMTARLKSEAEIKRVACW